MLKRLFGIAIAAIVFLFQVVPAAQAAQMDVATRTVPFNPEGATLTLSLKQVSEGKRLFQYACAQCHAGGVTKTDPNVGLDPEALDLATPPRNTVASLIDYMKNPTSYDGVLEISEMHPSLKSKDTFPEMRNLTEEDLTVIAGHVLMMPKVVGNRWGGGKIFY
ncbi:MAG: cytochrome c-550 [Alkalinema sp. CAN_BIN05]|nr:cytochrome c-550 [Alkalinema sp. CAN_BIN05]